MNTIKQSVAMGTTNTKQLDNNGEVNNVITIAPESPVDVVAGRLEIIMIVQTTLVAISLIMQCYKDYQRGLKKKYLRVASTITNP